MVDQMRFVISATMLLLATAGCQKRSDDGLSYSDKIATVTEWPTDALQPESLTDATALYNALQKINDAAPPVDYKNRTSWKQRQDYIDREVKRVLQDRDVLLVLKCAPGDQPLETLSFSTQDRNLRIRLYKVTDATKSDAELLIDLLGKVKSLQFDAERLAVLSGGQIALSPLDDFDERNKPLMDRLSDVENEGSIISTASTVQIEIANNPIRSSYSDLFMNITDAKYHWAKFRSALLDENRPDIGASEKAIGEAIDKWRSYPSNFVADKIWRENIPFTGDPKNVCLIGRFSSVETFSHSEKSQGLSANQTGWYIVDRTSMKIIASRRITGKDSND